MIVMMIEILYLFCESVAVYILMYLLLKRSKKQLHKKRIHLLHFIKFY